MFRRRGIATAVLAVVVLVIVVVAGVAAYEVLKPSSSSSSSTSAETMIPASSSSSSTSSSVATAASTCTLSSTSAASSASFNVIPLLNAISSMKLNYNLTSGGTIANLTEEYTRVYAGKTADKVNITSIVAGGENESETAWILKNGTTLALDIAGANLTGEAARGSIVGVFAGFSAEVEAADQLSTYTSTSFFHSVGTQSVTIGGNTFTVTNWSANTLPETITSCPPGSTENITAYKLSVGEPKGTSTNIVTFFELAGSSTSGGLTSSFDYVVQVVSFTVS